MDRGLESWCLIAKGADCARINCAPENAEVWAQMIANCRAAARGLSRDVRILMDLGGPKIRMAAVNKAARHRLHRGDIFILSDRLSAQDHMPEATDAAMGQRAESVMLNEGPYLAEAVAFLDRILRRMDRHRLKKQARLGPLQSWQDPQTLS